jgi:hypothetical protein
MTAPGHAVSGLMLATELLAETHALIDRRHLVRAEEGFA